MRQLFVLSVLALPATALADHPLGTALPDGVVVDVTEDGFGLVEGLIGDFIPPSIVVPPTSSSGGSLSGFLATGYELEIANLAVDIAVDNLSVTPGADVLNLDADATINVNSPGSPATLDIVAQLVGIEIVDEVCDLWVDPVHVSFNGAIEMQLVPDPAGVDIDGDGTRDTKRLDATVPPMTWSWDADGNDIEFGNCGLADVINGVNDVTSFFGLDIYDILIDSFEPTVDDLVTDLPAEIEPALEEAVASLTISEEIDLLGVPLDLTLWPETLVIQPDGMRIGMSTVVDVPVHECVAKYALAGSLATPGAAPGIGEAPGLPLTEHLGALIDDDWVNHVLFAAWSGGLLCYDLPSPDLELPLPIDTNLLELVAPGVFAHLFPETAPLVIRTDPSIPPVLDAAGPHDLDVVADDLGLGFYAEIDGRQARLVNIDLDVNVGVDLDFDATTGNLGVAVDMGDDAFVPSVTYNEFAPDSSAVIQGQFGGLLSVLVDPLIGGLLTDLVFAIPTFEGIGVLDLEAQSAGANGDWVGAFVEAGTVPYYSVGCDSSEGCDTSSCSSGCATGGPGFVVFAFPLVLAGLRRRR